MSMDTNKEAQGIDREQIPETITFLSLIHI